MRPTSMILMCKMKCALITMDTIPAFHIASSQFDIDPKKKINLQAVWFLALLVFFLILNQEFKKEKKKVIGPTKNQAPKRPKNEKEAEAIGPTKNKLQKAQSFY